MELETIRDIIKRRDGVTDSDVDDMFGEFKDMMDDGEDLKVALSRVFGLEPDYCFDHELVKACGY